MPVTPMRRSSPPWLRAASSRPKPLPWLTTCVMAAPQAFNSRTRRMQSSAARPADPDPPPIIPRHRPLSPSFNLTTGNTTAPVSLGGSFFSLSSSFARSAMPSSKRAEVSPAARFKTANTISRPHPASSSQSVPAAARLLPLGLDERQLPPEALSHRSLDPGRERRRRALPSLVGFQHLVAPLRQH